MQVCTSSQTTTPASHHSVFYRPDALPAAQPTASKHWRECKNLKTKKKIINFSDNNLFCICLHIHFTALGESSTHEEGINMDSVSVYRSCAGNEAINLVLLFGLKLSTAVSWRTIGVMYGIPLYLWRLCLMRDQRCFEHFMSLMLQPSHRLSTCVSWNRQLRTG